MLINKSCPDCGEAMTPGDGAWYCEACGGGGREEKGGATIYRNRAREIERVREWVYGGTGQPTAEAGAVEPCHVCGAPFDWNRQLAAKDSEIECLREELEQVANAAVSVGGLEESTPNAVGQFVSTEPTPSQLVNQVVRQLAASREECERLREGWERAAEHVMMHYERAEEAERKLREARGLLERAADTLDTYADECDHSVGICECAERRLRLDLRDWLTANGEEGGSDG